MFRDKTKVALRDLLEQAGNDGALRIIRESLSEKKIRPEDFSLREIWEACEQGRSVMEAVSSDMFPKITGELINSKIIDAYNITATIGDMLVTTVPSKMEVETVAGFDAVESPEEVQQGREYEDSTVGEKYVTIRNQKFGRLLSVTEEMIYFDKTGQILARGARIGEKAALYKEKLIVEGVQDVNSNVFNPSGVAAAFYRTAASGTLRINSVAATPFGESGMKAFEKVQQNMTDENGDPVLLNPANTYVLVPVDLWVEARQLARTVKVPEGNENADNVFKGTFTPLTSYYISAQSTTVWYAGDFRQDFWWSEVWPLQVMTAKPGHEAEFRRDVKSIHKVRFYGAIGAVSSSHAFKFTG